MTLDIGSPGNAGTSAAVRGRLLVVLGALSAFGPVTTHVYLSSLPQAAAALNTSPAGIQTSLTACLVGLAAGQLVAGPLSHSRGRRKLLLAAMGVSVLASALCARAPNIVALDLLRLLQGGMGGAGIAICFAVVRDLYAGHAAARAYSILMAVSSIAPIASPTIGGQLLRITDGPGGSWPSPDSGWSSWAAPTLGLTKLCRSRAARTAGSLLPRLSCGAWPPTLASPAMP
jgi:DHA1 family bicyclomycin/chloramphenicol resistance-like MFS transporter